MGALEILSNRGVELERINQIILAAADVDTAMMPRLAAHAVNRSTRLTSYVSDKDKALKLSKWLHKFPRVGVMPPTYLLSGMDTIVVNDADAGLLSHGYVSSSPRFLSDIFWLLKDNSPPGERFSVDVFNSPEGTCWRLKN